MRKPKTKTPDVTVRPKTASDLGAFCNVGHCELPGDQEMVMAQLARQEERPLTYRPCCEVYSSNEEHICVVYDMDHPCTKKTEAGTCGAPTVFTMDAAPGNGTGWACKKGHYEVKTANTEVL